MIYDQILAVAKDIIILGGALLLCLMVILTTMGIITAVRIHRFVSNIITTAEVIKNTLLEPLMIVSAFLAGNTSSKKKSKQQQED